MTQFTARTIAIMCFAKDPAVKEVEIKDFEVFEDILDAIIDWTTLDNNLQPKDNHTIFRKSFVDCYQFLIENAKITITNV